MNQNKYRNLFSRRGINCWNSFPNDVVNAPSISSFKHQISKLDFSNYLNVKA